ncbi:hypothetical protein HWV62_27085 [Athelia sp. TMB]|nr:hypothetical protein HWV62_27085 [Athelia sp. TMB]
MFAPEASKPDPHNLLIIAPIFYAYILGSVTGLRTWLAVQELPAIAEASAPAESVESQPDASVKRNRKNKKAMLFGILLGVAIGAIAGYYGIGDALNALVIAMVYLGFAGMCTMVFRELTGAPIVYLRTTQGDMAALSKTTRVVTRAVIVVLSLCLPTGAIWFNSDACASVMFFVAVFVIQGKQGKKTISLRRLIIKAALYELGLMVYLGIVSAVIWWSLQNEETVKPTRSITDEPPFGRAQWIYMLWPTVPLCRLLATALRFDYTNHAQANQSSTPIIAIATTPAPAAGGFTTGAIAPSWGSVLKVPFGRYYFGSAMTAWMCSNFIVYVLISREILPDIGRVVYTIYLLLISIPLIIAAVLGMSLVRGEAKRMWKYEEVWTVEPAAMEAAIAGGCIAASPVPEKIDEKVDVSITV